MLPHCIRLNATYAAVALDLLTSPALRSITMLASIVPIDSHLWPYFGPKDISILTFYLVLFAFGCKAIYNRYFHPLHIFPGPAWGSITDVYNTYLFATSRVHLEMLKLHQEYGKSHRCILCGALELMQSLDRPSNQGFAQPAFLQRSTSSTRDLPQTCG